MRSIRRTAVGAIGVAATALLHSLLFAVAIWGEGVAKVSRLPDAVGAGANSGRPDGTNTERMIAIRFVSDAASTSPEDVRTAFLAAVQSKALALEISGPDAIAQPPLVLEDEGDLPDSSDADLIARTRLAGIYESQIRARIERAWTQPEDSRDQSHYLCRVKIRQQQDGSIEEVKLESCEGSYAWLDSLVKAIQSASPLPAPPHPGVFVDSFSMVFRADLRQRTGQLLRQR